MKKQLTLLITALLIVTAAAVMKISSIGAAPSQTELSFSRDVQPILESRCGNCHFGEFTSADLHMDTYQSLMAGSENGLVILAGDARNSLLVKKISSGEMPERGPRLTPVQVQTIVDWINAGAQDN